MSHLEAATHLVKEPYDHDAVLTYAPHDLHHQVFGPSVQMLTPMRPCQQERLPILA